MTFLRNNCEGAASGTTITTANSDDNSAGDPLDISTSGTRIYDNSWTHSGTTSWKCEGTSGNTAILAWDRTDTRLAFRGYVKFSSPPSATCAILQARNSGSMGEVQMRTDGKIQVTDDTGAILHTTAAALSVDTTYRFEYTIEKGTTTSNGKVSFAYYLGDNASPVATAYTTTSANMGTADITSMRFGKLTGIASTWAVWLDDVAVDYGATAFIGPLGGDPELVYNIDTAIRKIPTAGSNGDITITQLSGTTATISEPTSGNFQAEFPADHTDVLTFEIEAQADGPPISETFSIYPTSLTTELIYDGTEWT